MGNELNLWEDIIQLERLKETDKAEFLLKCYRARYIDYNLEKAERLKEAYQKQYSDWDYY